ncbi:hypothetical protein SAMN05444362_11270 [Dysgonomonas macrotermitis]|uniref:Uncharacterized protein n=1 Tax=Dysgonomonas macrotermitis TaxID=1346286 RepID=A0A1M5FPL0_9BACT|nr:hypothetical protein SAMN05444362_11270 [Dysgonomonas macrotermitis]
MSVVLYINKYQFSLSGKVLVISKVVKLNICVIGKHKNNVQIEIIGVYVLQHFIYKEIFDANR